MRAPNREAEASSVRGLGLGPCVERVVDREFEFELALVIEAEERKPIGDGLEARRLRGGVAILGHVRAVDDPGHQGQSGIVLQLVLLDEDLERAEAVAVGEARSGCVEADRPLALGVGEDLSAPDIDDLGVRIDELPDEPRTGDPVGPGVLSGDPLHRAGPPWRLHATGAPQPGRDGG